MTGTSCLRRSGESPKRALVVDDSAGMRLYLSTILSTLGLTVVEAEDGAQAFDEVMSEDFNLVLTDLLMSNIDGFQLISAISLLPEGKVRPRIIACSALDEDDAQMQRPELRYANAILQKPVDAAELARVVMAVMAVDREDQPA